MSKIYVSSGHGGADPGAVSGKIQEKNLNLPLALAVADLLRKNGHEVMIDKTADKAKTIDAKAAEANKAKVDAVIDIHHNAGGGTGCEVYHHYGGGKSKTLAQKICAEIAKLGYTNRGPKIRKNEQGRDYFGIIRQTNAPAVLVEVCFIDSAADMARYDREKAAQAIVNGVLAVFPAPPKKPVPAPAPAPKAYKVGDVVDFLGGKHYVASTLNVSVGGNRKAGKAKITAINPKGKHPYHVIGQGGCNVYGWVDKAQIGG